MTPHPLATPQNYVAYGNRYILSGRYLSLPGALTDDPVKGASLYNKHLIKKLKHKGHTEQRTNRIRQIAQRFETNWRIRRVHSAVKAAYNDELICIHLSPLEREIFFMLF